MAKTYGFNMVENFILLFVACINMVTAMVEVGNVSVELFNTTVINFSMSGKGFKDLSPTDSKESACSD